MLLPTAPSSAAAVNTSTLALVVAASATGALVALIVGRIERWRDGASHTLSGEALQLLRSGHDTAPELAREDSLESSSRLIQKHTDDQAFRTANLRLMERGRANSVRAVGAMYAPSKTRVVRIALTGGPCAGKSSALEHLIAAATAEGFDILTAPEVATLYFNSSYAFPSISAPDFGEQVFTFQKNILKLQLQMERSFSDLAGSSGRPTIVVFDRGMLDCKAYLNDDAWERALAELNRELTNGRPVGSITDGYLHQRYDGVVHLVTAADGAADHYRHGVVADDSGNQVFRRETPAEAIEIDRKLRVAWAAHPRHVVVHNDAEGFHAKLAAATESILALARSKHPVPVRVGGRAARGADDK